MNHNHKLHNGYLISRELFLQTLFPRVCPICGEILKLPHKWFRIFLPGRKISDPDTCFSVLICRQCAPDLSFVAKPVCSVCSRPVFSEDERLCEDCKKKAVFFDSGSALLIHDLYAKKIIYGLKFQNRRDNAELLGLLMALRKITEIRLWKPEVLLPVPLHQKRYRERGFNQAQLIAEKLSFWLEKLYGIHLPVDPGFLIRTENTKPQRTIESSRRAGNVEKAFSVARTDCRYRSVILVDDIYTSGSTLNACARTLKKAGCRKVHFLTASIV